MSEEKINALDNIESVQVLQLQAGDVLVAKIDHLAAQCLSQDDIHFMQTEIERNIPEGVNLIIVSGVDFQVLRKSDAESRNG
jgi:hypothetical protein